MKVSLPDIHPQFLVNERGKKTAAVLDINDFKIIMKKLEDWHDILTIELVKKSKLPTYTAEEIEKEVLGKRHAR